MQSYIIMIIIISTVSWLRLVGLSEWNLPINPVVSISECWFIPKFSIFEYGINRVYAVYKLLLFL